MQVRSDRCVYGQVDWYLEAAIASLISKMRVFKVVRLGVVGSKGSFTALATHNAGIYGHHAFSKLDLALQRGLLVATQRWTARKQLPVRFRKAHALIDAI